jgi:hypothetical protein
MVGAGTCQTDCSAQRRNTYGPASTRLLPITGEKSPWRSLTTIAEEVRVALRPHLPSFAVPGR